MPQPHYLGTVLQKLRTNNKHLDILLSNSNGHLPISTAAKGSVMYSTGASKLQPSCGNGGFMRCSQLKINGVAYRSGGENWVSLLWKPSRSDISGHNLDHLDRYSEESMVEHVFWIFATALPLYICPQKLSIVRLWSIILTQTFGRDPIACWKRSWRPSIVCPFVHD